MRKFLQSVFLNNVIINNIIYALGIDKYTYKNSNPYLHFKTQSTKSTQENSGYSNRPEINEVLDKSKKDLINTVSQYCKEGDLILDIGCGAGMYLELFKNNYYELYATDINVSMLTEAKKNVPNANFILGNFTEIILTKKFNLIYCIGVLIYIPRYSIKDFFKKIYNQLEPNGIVYINYPHALSLLDAMYNDITYIQYSPKAIEEFIKPYFKIIKHEQAFDGRKVGLYDKTPYKSLNPNTNRTYKNSYLLIAQKIN